MDSSAELIAEVPGFIRLHKDGWVERLNGNERVPPSTDHHTTGVSLKDILIDPETALSARLYLPPLSGNHHRRPLLPWWWLLQRWAVRQTRPGTEPWIANHADLSHIMVAGDSAGANLIHHVAMRAGGTSAVHGSGPPVEDLVKIQGTLLVHPYFWSSTILDGELPVLAARVELIWKLACPASPGVDDPIMNPLAVGSLSLSGLGCRRVLVAIAGKDFLRGRGRWFYEALTARGWKGEAEVEEVEGEEHVFHLFRPEDEKAKLLLKRFASFINSE
ncbi:2-hydroxyisoflavanone dehydratase-like [Nymphaea colorata]|uniref:2-hydroxyisoflavanone dehydratase-like n=1 Tax=Nymphaea colorata TaxID=210225 RepID=UPI00129E9A19|nr:2-hydroxyisoflavanone dehydratase-like [Nymphaea colorata]